MIPALFKELDEVAHAEFAFLVSEKGCTGPTVEYWRDFFLVYRTSDGLIIRVGMERGTPIPFVFIEHRIGGRSCFEIRKILKKLGIPLSSRLSTLAEIIKSLLKDRAKLKWRELLSEYSHVLREHFEEIVGYAREQRSAAAIGPGAHVIGAGALFLNTPHFPIGRDGFWLIVNNGYQASYAAMACPSCDFVGNVGVEELKTRKPWGKARGIGCVLFPLSVFAFAINSYREGQFSLPILIVISITIVLLVFAPTDKTAHTFWCPRCGCRSAEFTPGQ